jgi:flagellar biosynthesis repressor protein FlbT
MTGLVLKLGPRERVMINGVVMENGDRRTRLNIVTPDANVLRLRDAIHPARGQHAGAAGLLHRPARARRRGRPEEGRRQLMRGIEQLSQVFRDADSRDPPRPPRRRAWPRAASIRRCGRCGTCSRARSG